MCGARPALRPSLLQLALGVAISYQGRLTDGGSPADGSYDLRFTLYDADSAGHQIGTVNTPAATLVSTGVINEPETFGPLSTSLGEDPFA